MPTEYAVGMVNFYPDFNHGSKIIRKNSLSKDAKIYLLYLCNHNIEISSIDLL